MRILALCSLLLMPMIHVAASGAAAEPSKIGVFVPAPCPVKLPPEVRLPDEASCGYVSVPERHAQPNGRVIQIAVARFPSLAASPAPDALILNTGGPGDSNMDQFLPLLSGAEGQALRAQRDIVIIELRGLRYSRPALVCHEAYAAQETMAVKDIKGNESNRILLEAMRACHGRLAREGIDVSAYNNAETAADIAMIMSGLGYKKFDREDDADAETSFLAVTGGGRGLVLTSSIER